MSDQAAPAPRDEPDFAIVRNGKRYAGVHVLVDLWGATNLDDASHVEETLKACCAAAGATILHVHVHRFTPGGGISGVAVLAESHISAHTWPEWGFAAFDIFMCGATQPEAAVPVLRNAFEPTRLEEHISLRGGRD
jgi:S-adenosylmethionine decarboxylase